MSDLVILWVIYSNEIYRMIFIMIEIAKNMAVDGNNRDSSRETLPESAEQRAGSRSQRRISSLTPLTRSSFARLSAALSAEPAYIIST